MSLTEEWIKNCLSLINEPAALYAADRKIIRNKSLTFKSTDSDIKLPEIGYASMKMTLLRKLYIHHESLLKAVEMWNYFLKRGKYASTSFHCYNHLIKEGATSPSEKVSTRGPCLQSVVITNLENNVAEVDIFYRSTEIFKKFPADLYFIYNELLPHFNFSKVRLNAVNCHFANITFHPMYIVTPLALYPKPVEFLNYLNKDDKFTKNVMKWILKYFEDDTGIKKFRQAMVVKDKAREMLYPHEIKKLIRVATEFLNENK